MPDLDSKTEREYDEWLNIKEKRKLIFLLVIVNFYFFIVNYFN